MKSNLAQINLPFECDSGETQNTYIQGVSGPATATEIKLEYDPYGADPKKDGAKLDGNKIPVWQGVIDYFPRALQAVADISAFGASKYSWKDWETVPDGFNRYSNAEARHMMKISEGEKYDPDSHRLHLSHKAWNALAVLEMELRSGTPLKEE